MATYNELSGVTGQRPRQGPRAAGAREAHGAVSLENAHSRF